MRDVTGILARHFAAVSRPQLARMRSVVPNEMTLRHTKIVPDVVTVAVVTISGGLWRLTELFNAY